MFGILISFCIGIDYVQAYSRSEPLVWFYGFSATYDSTCYFMFYFSIVTLLNICFVRFMQSMFQFEVSRKFLPTTCMFCLVLYLKYNQKHFETVNDITGMSIHLLLLVYLPVLSLRASYNIDYHIFASISSQSIVIVIFSLPGAFIIGYAMEFINSPHNMKILPILVHAVTFFPTQPYFIIHLVSYLEKYDMLRQILELESFFGITFTLSSVQLIMSFYKTFKGDYIPVAYLFAQLVIVGVVIGCFTGQIIVMHMKYLKLDVNSLYLLSLGILYFSYAFSFFFQFSYTITLLVSSCIILIGRRKLIREHDRTVSQLANSIFYFVDQLVYFDAIVKLGRVCLDVRPKVHLMLANVTFMLVFKSISLMIIYPLLRRLGFQYKMPTLLIIGWANINSTITIIITMLLYNTRGTITMSETFLMYCFFNAMCSTLLNETAMSAIVKVMNVGSISRVRIMVMENAIKSLKIERDKYVELLKLNRLMADVNWAVVRCYTTLTNPYVDAMRSSKQEQEPDESQQRKLFCPGCKKVVDREEATVVTSDTENDTRKKIWKAMKTIVTRHQTSGLISEECRIMLTKAFDSYIEANDEKNVYLDKLHVYHKHNKFILFLKSIHRYVFSFKRQSLPVPRNRFRKVCYKIAMNRGFKVVVIWSVIFTTTAIIFTIAANVVTKSMAYIQKSIIYLLIISYFLIQLDFWLTIFAYSWVYVISDGFVTYFKSFHHVSDFIALIFSTIELSIFMLVYFDVIHELSEYEYTYISLYRVIWLMVLASQLYPNFISMIDAQLDAKLAFGYENAKALKNCYDEILPKMNMLFDECQVRTKLTEMFQEDLEHVQELMRTMQMYKPTIVTTVKTKMMISATITNMLQTLNDLKSSGFVDDFEYKLVLVVIKAEEKLMNNIKSLQSSSPSMIFNSISWTHFEAQDDNYLYSRALLRNFPTGATICSSGENLHGIIIVLSGVIKLQYDPTEKTLSHLQEKGMLPVVDHFDSLRYLEPQDIYIIPGNSIGSLNFLTGRPYDCKITVEADLRIFFLQSRFIREVMRYQSDLFIGVEAKMWKCAMADLACSVLQYTKSNTYSLSEIQTLVERSFVPNLNKYKTFTIKDLVECMVLLYGTICDMNTNDVYIAPCYVPRSVIKFRLGTSVTEFIEGHTITANIATGSVRMASQGVTIPEDDKDEAGAPKGAVIGSLKDLVKKKKRMKQLKNVRTASFSSISSGTYGSPVSKIQTPSKKIIAPVSPKGSKKSNQAQSKSAQVTTGNVNTGQASGHDSQMFRPASGQASHVSGQINDSEMSHLYPGSMLSHDSNLHSMSGLFDESLASITTATLGKHGSHTMNLIQAQPVVESVIEPHRGSHKKSQPTDLIHGIPFGVPVKLLIIPNLGVELFDIEETTPDDAALVPRTASRTRMQYFKKKKNKKGKEKKKKQ